MHLHWVPLIAIFTTRKRSLRRLCFYTCLSFCPWEGGGGSASVHAGIPPPRPGTPPRAVPLDQAPPPPRAVPLDQAPPSMHTPPGAVHAGRYGQRAGGMHPTGMQPCGHYEHSAIMSRLYSQKRIMIDINVNIKQRSDTTSPANTELHLYELSCSL